MMFKAYPDVAVEDRPVRFEGMTGLIPQLLLIDGQPDIVEAQRGKISGILFFIFYRVIGVHLAKPVTDIDPSFQRKTIRRSGATERRGVGRICDLTLTMD